MAISLNGIGLATVAAAGTPQQLTATITKCKDFWVRPLKALPSTANTGNIYIGLSTMVKATGVGVMILLKTGDAPVNIRRPDSTGEHYDLSNIYIDADNNGDGALIGFEGQQ